MPFCRGSLMARAVTSLLIIRGEASFLNEVHVSSASFNTLFQLCQSYPMHQNPFFSESQMALTQMCSATLLSTIDPWKPWKKHLPHYLHSGSYLVNNSEGNGHHSLLFGFCFNFVLYLERDITESMLRVSCRRGRENSYSLVNIISLALSSEQSTENSEHILTRRWRSSKSPAVAKRKKLWLVLLSPAECCQLIRFGQISEIWPILISLCCGLSCNCVQ